MAADHDEMPSEPAGAAPSPLAKPGPELAERNHEIIAGRCGWPDGALAACRDLERQHPGWHAWWTDRPWRRDGNVPDGPCFGAAPDCHRPADSLYAASPAALAEAIEAADDTRRRAYPWLYR